MLNVLEYDELVRIYLQFQAIRKNKFVRLMLELVIAPQRVQ